MRSPIRRRRTTKHRGSIHRKWIREERSTTSNEGTTSATTNRRKRQRRRTEKRDCLHPKHPNIDKNFQPNRKTTPISNDDESLQQNQRPHIKRKNSTRGQKQTRGIPNTMWMWSMLLHWRNRPIGCGRAVKRSTKTKYVSRYKTSPTETPNVQKSEWTLVTDTTRWLKVEIGTIHRFDRRFHYFSGTSIVSADDP